MSKWREWMLVQLSWREWFSLSVLSLLVSVVGEARAVAIVDYGAAMGTATAELGSAVLSALPLFGTVVAVGVGMRIVKKFWSGGDGRVYEQHFNSQGDYDGDGGPGNEYENDLEPDPADANDERNYDEVDPQEKMGPHNYDAMGNSHYGEDEPEATGSGSPHGSEQEAEDYAAWVARHDDEHDGQCHTCGEFHGAAECSDRYSF
jgi:hypothetical protein